MFSSVSVMTISTQPQFRTMWMIPRNIRKIEPWKICQIATLLDAAGGAVRDQALQDALYEELASNGLKCKRAAFGVEDAGGMRTYLAQLACLGLFWKDPTSNSYKTTRAGDELLAANNPVKVLTCQLLRMQYPSVYGNGVNVRISPLMRVKPFVFLVNLLRRDDLDRKLSSDEIAVAVVYGRTHADEGKCAEKILAMRAADGKFASVVDRLEDLNTPKRWKGDPGELWEKGIEDARTIGNTFKNYMEAVGLIAPLPEAPRYYALAVDPSLSASVSAWCAEPIKPAPTKEGETRWQLNFGRYDRTKVQLSSQQRRNGLEALLSARYLAQAGGDPYGFDHDHFVTEEARRWNKPVTDVETMVKSLKPKVPDVFRNTLLRAAISGGKEATVLEKGVVNLFKRLGFDEARHFGQTKARKNRQGGYPDIYIRSSKLPVSAWADTKATVRYDFPITDRTKLETYYKNCWEEVDANAPPLFFLYVAGGFERFERGILSHLRQCADAYERPVSAVTVEALCDLVGCENRPDPEQIMEAFSEGTYFNSSAQIAKSALSRQK